MTSPPGLLVCCGLEVLSWSPGNLRLTTVCGVVPPKGDPHSMWGCAAWRRPPGLCRLKETPTVCGVVPPGGDPWLLAEGWASMTCLPSHWVCCGLEVLSRSPGDLRLTTVCGVVGRRPVICLAKVDERLGWREPGWSGNWNIKGWLWRLAKASKKVGLANQKMAGNPQRIVTKLSLR